MRKYSNAEQQELLREFTESGLKASAFCRNRGINPKTFSNWIYKSCKSGGSQNSIIPIAIKPAGSTASTTDGITAITTTGTTLTQATIRYPNGVVVEFEAISSHELPELVNRYTPCSR